MPPPPPDARLPAAQPSTDEASMTATNQTVFLSHASEDAAAANALCSFLEAKGVPCWIAPRDVPTGADHAVCIPESLATCKAMVILLSKYSADSSNVRNEVGLAFDRGLPLVPMRLDHAPFGKLEFHLHSVQWIEAWQGGIEAHQEKVLRALDQREGKIAAGHPLAPLGITHSLAYLGWMLAALGDEQGLEPAEREEICRKVGEWNRRFYPNPQEAMEVSEREVTTVMDYAQTMPTNAQYLEMGMHLALVEKLPLVARKELTEQLLAIGKIGGMEEPKQNLLAHIHQRIGVEQVMEQVAHDQDDVRAEGGVK